MGRKSKKPEVGDPAVASNFMNKGKRKAEEVIDKNISKRKADEVIDKKISNKKVKAKKSSEEVSDQKPKNNVEASKNEEGIEKNENESSKKQNKKKKKKKTVEKHESNDDSHRAAKNGEVNEAIEKNEKESLKKQKKKKKKMIVKKEEDSIDESSSEEELDEDAAVVAVKDGTAKNKVKDDSDSGSDDDTSEEAPATKTLNKSTYDGLDSNSDDDISFLVRSGRTVLVKGFYWKAKEDEMKDALRKHFSSCGDVTRIDVPSQRDGNGLKGFAYIDFPTKDEFKKALLLNYSELDGYYLSVQEASCPIKHPRRCFGYLRRCSFSTFSPYRGTRCNRGKRYRGDLCYR